MPELPGPEKCEKGHDKNARAQKMCACSHHLFFLTGFIIPFIMACSKFHVDNDVIITTNDEITVEEVFNHLKGRLRGFRDKSQFILICGYHTSKTGEVGAIDHDLLYDYQCLFERFHNHMHMLMLNCQLI